MPFFKFALDSGATPESAILACYNLEVIARETESVELANEAIEILTVKMKHLLADQQFAAESDHLHGHLLLLKGRLQKTRALGLERIGTQFLARAAGADPSYFGCYASSFAEHGDYLGSIEACQDILRQDSLGDLTLRDTKLVRLELLFYMAYSLMAIGEIARAELCFHTFVQSTTALGLFEARDHARLFLVKLGLRRTPLNELDDATLTSAYRELRSLSFREALSIPVEAECQRYEEIVQFLRSIVGLRREFTRDLLQKVGQAASLLLSNLGAKHAVLVRGLSVAVGPVDVHPDAVASFIKTGRQRCTMVPDLLFEEFRGDELPAGRGGTDGFTYIVSADVSDASDASKVALNCIPFTAGSLPDSLESGESAVDFLLIGLATVALRRFWTQDHYVFGIVPCVESPATKFQRRRYTLHDFL